MSTPDERETNTESSSAPKIEKPWWSDNSGISAATRKLALGLMKPSSEDEYSGTLVSVGSFDPSLVDVYTDEVGSVIITKKATEAQKREIVDFEISRRKERGEQPIDVNRILGNNDFGIVMSRKF